MHAALSSPDPEGKAIDTYTGGDISSLGNQPSLCLCADLCSPAGDSQGASKGITAVCTLPCRLVEVITSTDGTGAVDSFLIGGPQCGVQLMITWAVDHVRPGPPLQASTYGVLAWPRRVISH
jgi:hypothetical protein